MEKGAFDVLCVHAPVVYAQVPYLENECERRLLDNRTVRAVELGEAPGEVVTALRCPNLCNGNGRCTEWACQCYPSYSFYDCSLAISEYTNPARMYRCLHVILS